MLAAPECAGRDFLLDEPLTAFAALRLVDRGLLALGAPVNRCLRSWRLPDGDVGSGDSVTVARLLGHMAGLNDPGFPGYGPGAEIPTLTQILDGTGPANTPPIRVVRRPGAGRRYSGGGYVVPQQLLEDVTGQGSRSSWAVSC